MTFKKQLQALQVSTAWNSGKPNSTVRVKHYVQFSVAFRNWPVQTPENITPKLCQASHALVVAAAEVLLVASVNIERVRYQAVYEPRFNNRVFKELLKGNTAVDENVCLGRVPDASKNMREGVRLFERLTTGNRDALALLKPWA